MKKFKTHSPPTHFVTFYLHFQVHIAFMKHSYLCTSKNIFISSYKRKKIDHQVSIILDNHKITKGKMTILAKYVHVIHTMGWHQI